MPATRPLPKDTWTAIADAADQVRRTEWQLDRERAALDGLIAQAVAGGGQVEAIANASNLSRQSVYAATNRELRRRDNRRSAHNLS